VATPIGNLEDVTARALRVLRECDRIAAEDTRVTRKLLAHFDIHTPLVAYHAHSGETKTGSLIDALRAGQHIALVSDAGTPLLSDPGAELVAAAAEAGIRVEPVPGPSALLAGLVASGLPTGRFVFEGFLPRTRGDRWERVAALAREPRTVVLYEAPPRLVETLQELAKAAGGDRRVVVGRELTKRFEEFRRGTLDDVTAHYEGNPPRGECVIVLEGAPVTGDDSEIDDPDVLLRSALARGQSPRDAARSVAQVTGLPRNDLYARLLRLADSDAPGA
jgi:16S rRNA (cytidine1402-2'-O)-methyltransferase